MTISILNDSCIRCGKCARVCPSLILVQATDKAEISVRDEESCISCGHCVAVCPSGAVCHTHFPADKVHPVDAAQLPTPEQVLLLCRARRSNRAFSAKPIPEAYFDGILEAAHRAPTASNSQQMRYLLVTDPAKLKAISEYAIGVFDGVAKMLTNPFLKPILKLVMPAVYKYEKAFSAMKAEYDGGYDLILRKATAVLFIYSDKDNRYGCEDANLAYQNGSLMAESLGVSQFYTGFVLAAIKQDGKDTLTKILGIEGKIYAGMALAMPQFRYPNYIDRKPINLKRL